MDERTKELAMKYKENLSERIKRSEKFPMKLPESQEQMAAMLLGSYGAVVESRDMDLMVDDATVSKVEKVVKWMYESRRRGLLLCGTLGNGKTTMLRALKNLLGSKASYFEAQFIYDYFRQNRCLPDMSYDCVLMIDDLGVEPPTYNDFGGVRFPLTELLMKRYKNNLTTVIATNKTFDQIGETYGDRLQDRMREMFAMITYLEPSYRK